MAVKGRTSRVTGICFVVIPCFIVLTAGVSAGLQAPLLAGELPLQINLVQEAKNATGTTQLLAFAVTGSVIIELLTLEPTPAGTLFYSMTIKITSATQSNATATSDGHSYFEAGSQLSSRFEYSPTTGTINTTSVAIYNGSTLLSDDQQAAVGAKRLHAQVATSLLDFQAADTTQTYDMPQESTSKPASSKPTKPPQFRYQYLVQHRLDTHTLRTTPPSGAAATSFTRVKSTGYLAPTEESMRAATGSIPYIPSGFSSVKLLDAQGSIAISRVENVIELYTSTLAGPGGDMVQMRVTITAGDADLLANTASRGPAQLISAEKLYPGGSFAEYRTALAAASRNKAVTPAATTGDRAAPSWINNYSNSFGTDKTNGTYMQYTFLKSGNCVTYDSAYLSASAENMCYGAFGVARAQLKTTVDEKAFSRVTSWDGTIWMVLRGTVFGADVDILEYDVKAGAGYEKNKTGLTTFATYSQGLKLFPRTSYERALASNSFRWSADFSQRCADVAATRTNTSAGIWRNAVRSATASIDLVNVLNLLGVPNIGLVSIRLSASITLRYTVTPCTTPDGNYAVAVGVNYESGAELAASLSANAAGWAAGGVTLEGSLVNHEESMIMAWPADDVLQARDFSPACRYRSSNAVGLRISAAWWYQTIVASVVCAVWGECPLTFSQQDLVGDPNGPYDCCTGDYRYFWWSFPTTILNSNPGWQCPADRYLNMDQQNFTVPAPLCDASTTLTDAKGVIASHKQATSPDELENYKPHSQCEWVLPTLAVGGKVVIEATFVDLEPLFDTLTVVDGGGLLASIGAPQKVTLIQEGTSPMRLKFKSDASFRYKGFFLEYQTEPPAAITEAEQAYNVTFAIIVTGQEMTYSVLSSESSTARQTLTAAISSTFGVYKSQVQITVTAPAKHRRSLLQDKTALAILQGSRAPMSNVAVTVAGVSNAHSQDIVSAVADGTLDQSVETQLEAAGIASTVSVFQMPKVVKPQPPTPSPAPQQLGVSDASTGSGTYISNKPRSTSDIVVSKKMPIGPIVGAAVGAITLLVGAVAGIVVRKRRQAQQANSSRATQPGEQPTAAAAASALPSQQSSQGSTPPTVQTAPVVSNNAAPSAGAAQHAEPPVQNGQPAGYASPHAPAMYAYPGAAPPAGYYNAPSPPPAGYAPAPIAYAVPPAGYAAPPAGYAVAPAGYASMPAAAAAAAAAAGLPPQGPGPAFAAGMPAGPANGAPMMYYAQPAPGSAPPAAAPPAPYTKA